MLTRIECDALRGVANCAFAPRCRAKPRKGFLRDVGVRVARGAVVAASGACVARRYVFMWLSIIYNDQRRCSLPRDIV